MKTINTKDAATKDLVEFYNTNLKELPVGDKRNPIKKFASRKVAVNRVEDLIADMDVVRMFDEIRCPHCDVHLSNGAIEHEITENEDGPIALDKFQFYCMACGEEFGPEIEADAAPKHTNNAEGVAKSWLDPEVAAKRAQRSGVEVDGVYFGSVGKAYAALRIPKADLISFRMHLKEVGATKVDGRAWKIVPLNYK